MNSYSAPLPYIAVIKPVREISLMGWADLSYWREKLAAEELTPVEFDGRAQLLISSIASRFMGLPFRELIVAVTVHSLIQPAPQHGVFLVHAFNSSRLLGWCERKMFSTPYYYGHIENVVGPPAAIELRSGQQPLLKASMASAPTASRCQPEGWAGPIFLPSPAGVASDRRQVFFADLQGETTAYPYRPERDQFVVQRSLEWPVFDWLRESEFVGYEWTLRANATHSRTKTIRLVAAMSPA